LKRFGMIRAISASQLLAAVALVLLAAFGTPSVAALGYAVFMIFQYMCEPGLYSLLMDSVPETGRNTASALNFLVSSCAQALAAGVAGALVQRLGYPPVLVTAAFVCAIAALLFRLLVRPSVVDKT
jgi:predicted MFS family arabinose efflux permease